MSHKSCKPSPAFPGQMMQFEDVEVLHDVHMNNIIAFCSP